MLSKFLKDRINIAKKIIEDLSDEYEYISKTLLIRISFILITELFFNTLLILAINSRLEKGLVI